MYTHCVLNGFQEKIHRFVVGPSTLTKFVATALFCFRKCEQSAVEKTCRHRTNTIQGTHSPRVPRRTRGRGPRAPEILPAERHVLGPGVQPRRPGGNDGPQRNVL